MNVKHVMRPAAAVLPQNATLDDVMRAFLRHRVEALPIVDAAQRSVGMVTVHDLVDVCLPRYNELLRDFSALEDKGQLSSALDAAAGSWESVPGKLILAVDLVRGTDMAIFEDDPLLAAAARLQASRQHRLPVVDRDRRLVGVLCEEDIILALLNGRAAVQSPGVLSRS